MNSNLDVWAIQYYPEELYTALNQIDKGMSIIYSNLICNFKIGNQQVKTRQFDTALYNEESDILIMLMRGGKATKKDIIEYLDRNDKEYAEVSFAKEIEEYKDGNDIDELWFAREEYVLRDAIDDSLQKGNNSCDYYPVLEGNLSLEYMSNQEQRYAIDGRLFKGLIKLDDKIVLIINQPNNVDLNGLDRNLSYDIVLKVLKEKNIKVMTIVDQEPKFYKDSTNKVK